MVVVMRMQLNEAVVNDWQNFFRPEHDTVPAFYESGVPKSTIGNVINCSYESVKLRIIHEMPGTGH